MKITKFKKEGTSKYKVELENKESLILYEDTIIKYNLLYKKELPIDKLNEILEFNEFSKAYEESIKFLNKKMHCKKELKEHLTKNSFNDYIINSVIKRLQDNKLLNEEQYIKSYINDKMHLSKEGPYKIKEDLLKKELDESTINNYINEIPQEEIEEKIEKYINKKKKINSKYSEKMLNNKLKQELINLGYESEIIEKYLFTNENNNDLELIEKDFNKILFKYQKKYKDNELKQKIKSYLYTKGYRYEDINMIIEKI